MLKIKIILLSVFSFFLLVSCESNEKNNLNKEIERRQNTLPQVHTPDQENAELNITPLTNLTPAQEKIKEEAIAVIKKNLKYTQEENEKGVLTTIHEDSPQLESTKKGMDYVFSHFDMKYQLLEAEVISITKNEVQVFYKQKTQAVKGTGFMDKVAQGIHILRKSKDGHWKIYKTEYL